MRKELKGGLLLLVTLKDHKSEAVDAVVTQDYKEANTLRLRERRGDARAQEGGRYLSVIVYYWYLIE